MESLQKEIKNKNINFNDELTMLITIPPCLCCYKKINEFVEKYNLKLKIYFLYEYKINKRQIEYRDIKQANGLTLEKLKIKNTDEKELVEKIILPFLIYVYRTYIKRWIIYDLIKKNKEIININIDTYKYEYLKIINFLFSRKIFFYNVDN